jgi:hypothetical protein
MKQNFGMAVLTNLLATRLTTGGIVANRKL